MLPFTRDQFLAVFSDYNAALWPASLVAYFLAGLLVVAILIGSSSRTTLGPVVLFLMWAWTGLAYHFAFFSRINALAPLFAVLFVLQAVAILYWGLWQRRLTPDSWLGLRSGVGWALIAYAAIAYPLIGLAAGHPYDSLPQFGVTPCPVSLFTVGLFLLMRKPLPWPMWIIPIIWSLIGGSAAILLDVPQDWPLLASGLISMLIIGISRD